MAQTPLKYSVDADNSPDALTHLIVEASEVIPPNIELMLLKHIASSTSDPVKIRNIVALYVSGAVQEATLEVDMLDGQEDGRLFGTKLEGADLPRRRARLKSDPD